MVDIPSVIRGVNAARAVCSRPPIDQLPKGERRSPYFCPVSRALRKDLDESFLLAVGTHHLRICSFDRDTITIGSRIRKAWGLNDKNVGREGDQFATLRLPPELTQFVIDFDAGKLPEFEGKVDLAEVLRLNPMAKRSWDITIANLRTTRSARVARN